MSFLLCEVKADFISTPLLRERVSHNRDPDLQVENDGGLSLTLHRLICEAKALIPAARSLPPSSIMVIERAEINPERVSAKGENPGLLPPFCSDSVCAGSGTSRSSSQGLELRDLSP